MLITIGILARNEAANIGNTIRSLLSQSVFLTENMHAVPPSDWRIVVVANGCADDTADCARESLVAACSAAQTKNVTFEVATLQRPGKSNAWNEFIHQISPKETDIFILLDADIEFGHLDTLANSINTLLADPRDIVVVDRPLKNFTRKASPSFLERASVAASKSAEQESPGIAGSFYCARSATLRQVWMPIGLSVEDGFLAAMVTSDFFRGSPDHTRIVRATNATHYYKGLTDIREVILHEVRLVIGTLLNCYLCWDALLFLTPANSAGSGPIIRDLNASKPDWYPRMMANQIAARGYWIIPTAMLFRRWINWWKLPWQKRIFRLPLTFAAFAFDVIVLVIANWKMVTGRAVGYW